MTEEGLSINVVVQPTTKKKTKLKKIENIANAGQGEPLQFPQQEKSSKSRKNKMTVWKALKGKQTPERNNNADEFHGNKGSDNRRPHEGSNWKSTKLFANNPEVPFLPQRVVQPILEPVFSSKQFGDLNIHKFMVKNLEENLGLTCLTAVQEKLIPILLSDKKKDALVRSQTGSGKTLAFAIPIVEALQEIRPKITRADGIRALVVVPSRELALQIHEIFVKLCKSFTWLVPGILMGGEKRKAEKARLRKGITILTCTPGRLLDHLNKTDCLDLSKVEHFVLDEADRMLDLGYEKDVSEILNAVKGSAAHQTVLLSATLTPGVERLAGLSLHKPVRVDVVDVTPSTVPVEVEDIPQDAIILPGALTHGYIVTPAKLRLVALTAFVMDKCLIGGKKMIVFMATPDMVDLHTSLLSSGIEVFSGGQELQLLKLHGNMAQGERMKVFQEFRTASKSSVLLCTDVAARGLDLPEVDLVVQYTGPASVADYVHRVGRTARRGLPGSAVIFLSTNEVAFIERLESARVRLSPLRVEEVLEKLTTINTEYKSMQEAATRLQGVLEEIVEEEKDVHDLACQAYTSWVRFYASYPRELKECFSVKAVHLGHFAKSFALREPPTAASQHARTVDDKTRLEKKRPRREGDRGGPFMKPRGPKIQKRKTVISEFDSGLEPIKKRKAK